MAQYSSFARSFSRSRSGLVWNEIDLILDFLSAHSPTLLPPILDIGCGSGRLFQRLDTRDIGAVSLLGIDPCDELLVCAREYAYRGLVPTYSLGDFLCIDSGKNLFSFGIITAIASFHHVIGKEAARQAVDNIYKHLSPGGYFAMTNWNLLHPQYDQKYGVYRSEGSGGQIYVDIPFEGCHRRYIAWTPTEIESLFGADNWIIHHNSPSRDTERNLVTIVQKKDA